MKDRNKDDDHFAEKEKSVTGPCKKKLGRKLQNRIIKKRKNREVKYDASGITFIFTYLVISNIHDGLVVSQPNCNYGRRCLNILLQSTNDIFSLD